MAFLRSENKRLAMDNEALKAALKQRNRDIDEVEARFMRECMACELRRGINANKELHNKSGRIYKPWGNTGSACEKRRDKDYD